MYRALVAIILLVTGTAAVAEGSWVNTKSVDEFTNKTSYIVRRIVVGGYSSRYVRSFGFECRDGDPYFTASYDQFIHFANQTFVMLVKIDDNDLIKVPMRMWSNSTDSGYSLDERAIRQLVTQMKAGSKLIWRVDTSSDRLQGELGLNGFTAKSKQFIDACLIE